MFALSLDTGQFYQHQGTVSVEWTNAAAWPYHIERVSLWGGLSIGATMDFACALYVTNPNTGFWRVGPGATHAPGWLPLAWLALDRYGTSNGQNYQQDKDWDHYGLFVDPGEKLILHGNCFQHNPGANPVMGTPASADNAHAQAYIWMT